MEKPKISRREAEIDIAIDIEKFRVLFQKYYDKGNIDIVDPKSFEYEIAVLMQRETLWKRCEKFCEIIEEEAEN
jgi:hypothetical protein